MASCPLKRDGFLFQTGSKHTLVEPKMEMKYAAEYSTGEESASES